MPVPYATYADLQGRYGAQQLIDDSPRPAGFDPEDPDDSAADFQLFWERMILAASVDIDASLARAGYATPIVESDGTTVLPEAAPLLREWAVLFALDLAQLSRLSESGPINGAIEKAKAKLGQYVSGELRLSGVGVPDASIGAGLSTQAESFVSRYGEPRFRDIGNVLRTIRVIPS